MIKRRPCTAGVVFAVYCLILLWIVLFKTALSPYQLKMLYSGRSLNLIPFYYADNMGRIHLRETVMNIVVFVPVGVYFKMFGVRLWKGVVYGALISLGLELCQLVFGIGSTDVTDLITNTLGTAIGCLCYMAALRIFGNKKRTDRVINAAGIIAISLFLLLALTLALAN